MRTALLGIALLSAATLSASDNELNLLVSKQMTRDLSVPAGKVEVSDPVAISLRYGRDLIGLGPAQLQLQAGYHAESTADMKFNGVKNGEYKNTGYSLGLQAQWRMGVVLGAGAEMRMEKLKAVSSTGQGSYDTTQVRPWVTGRVGFSLPLPLVQPVFGLEVAAPLTKKDVNASSSQDDALKAMAPSFEVSVYGGVRF